MSKFHFNFRIPAEYTIAKRGQELNKIYPSKPLNQHYDHANALTKKWLQDLKSYATSCRKFDACDPVRLSALSFPYGNKENMVLHGMYNSWFFILDDQIVPGCDKGQKLIVDHLSAMQGCIDYVDFLMKNDLDMCEIARPKAQTHCATAWIDLIEKIHVHVKKNLIKDHYKHSAPHIKQYCQYMINYVHAATRACEKSTQCLDNSLNVEDMQTSLKKKTENSSMSWSDDYVATRVWDIGLMPYYEWPLFLPREGVAEVYGDMCNILNESEKDFIINHPILYRMKINAAAHVALVNDIISVDKEIDHLDVNNYAIILANMLKQESIGQAISETIQFTNGILDKIIEDQKLVTKEINEKFNNDITVNQFMNQYCRAMNEWIDGNVEWHLTVDRYSQKILTA